MFRYLAFVSLVAFAACQSGTPEPQEPDHSGLVFVGTYTQKLGHVDGKASGIYTCTFDTLQGVLTLRDSVTGLDNPSYVCIAPNRKFLYAVGENGGKPEQPYGSVAAYSIGPKGHLTKINEMPTYGAAPCHVSTDESGKFVFIANYSTGNIASYGVNADGSLTDSLCTRQHPGQEPNAHQVVTSKDNLVWAADKGADQVFLYELKPNGFLQPLSSFQTPAGAGPRHIDFHPGDNTLMAVVNELNSTIMTFRYSRELKKYFPLGTASTLPDGYSGQNACADIHFHPNKKMIYASNRGMDNIAIFELDALMGELKLIGHSPSLGAIPRSFLITPDGKWMLVAHQNSSTVSIFKIEKRTGLLTPVGAPVPVPTPVCLKM